MNLLEPVVASLVFCLVATASLQIGALALVAGQAQAQRQSLQDRIEAELIATESWLRQQIPSSPRPSCGQIVPHLAASLGSEALPPGLRRQVEPSADGQALVVRVAAPMADGSRERLLHPAALGLCGAEEADAAP